jgi:hypothetical protein
MKYIPQTTQNSYLIIMQNAALNKIRILWLCLPTVHETAKKEDGQLFVDAGFEFIPNGTEPSDDTSNSFWKNECTLSTSVLDVIRIDWTSDEAKQCINEHIHAIMIPGQIGMLGHFLSWFKGYVIFRAYGHGALTTYTDICGAMGLDTSIFRNDKYIWCPIHSALSFVETCGVINNEFVIGAFVSPSRLDKYKWNGGHSEPKIFEVFSGINRMYYSDMYKTFKNHFGDNNYIILGFNSKIDSDPHIMGTLDNDTLYNTMCSCRCLPYTGLSDKHLHYHAIEAIEMGIPVIFSSGSMIADCCRIFNVNIEKAWVYNSWDEAKHLVNRCLLDIGFAKEISAGQREIVNRAFDRKVSLKRAQELKKHITNCSGLF